MNAIETIQQSTGVLQDLLVSVLEDTDALYRETVKLYRQGETVQDQPVRMYETYSVTVKGVSPEVALKVARRRYLDGITSIRLAMVRRSKRYRDLNEPERETVLSILSALSEAGLNQLATLTFRSEKANRDLSPRLTVHHKATHESKPPPAHLYSIGELSAARYFTCQYVKAARTSYTNTLRGTRTSNVDVSLVWRHVCKPSECPRDTAQLCDRCMVRYWLRDCLGDIASRMVLCPTCRLQTEWRDAQYPPITGSVDLLLTSDDTDETETISEWFGSPAPMPLAECAERYALGLGERKAHLFDDMATVDRWHDALVSTQWGDTSQSGEPVLADTPDSKPEWQVRLENYLKEKRYRLE